MEDTFNNEYIDDYTGTPINPTILRCPACGTHPVKWIKQHGRLNEGEKARYTCEICDDGKE